MADLTAKFRLIDDMSEKLGNIADRGTAILDHFDAAGQAMNEAFGVTEEAATQTAHSIDGVAYSADSYSSSLEAAGQMVDNWTAAVGNYDKSALEAVYSTEELVEMGMKSADAMAEQERMFELCEQSATSLNRAIEASTDIHSELSTAIEKSSDVMNTLSDSESVSAETKQALSNSSEAAAEAMRELEAAQTEAAAAMANYDAVMISGTEDMDTLEAAAERACHASEALAEANEKATNATEELSKASDEAAEESEKAGESGINAINGIASALAAAGITATIKEISDAAFELADAFSEAENTVVLATGAAGEALDGLMKSTMNAYSAAKNADFSSTAGAIGEINTRMALTGEELTDVTGKFLDFSSITGTDVVGSVQNVTKIMNKWNVESSEVEGVLDKLAYTAQVSGISVDTLSSDLITGASSFQEMGFSLDNTISLLGQFELYGMSGTTTITAMRTAVKNFSGDGLDAQTALQSVIEEIANMENAADATALAVDTFGSRAGVDMANAIRSGELSVDAFTQSLEVAEGTLAATATTAQTLDQKWQQASNNIKTAFTTAIEPSISKTSSSFAEFMNGIGDYLNEHPRFTKAITAVAIGLGTVAVGIAGVSFATTVAIPAISAFGVALNASLGPIGWVALAVTGVVAAGTALAVMFSETTDATENMTMHTREQYYKLEDLNEEYERTCSVYGKTSEQAGELALQISQLEEEYNSTAETIGEFVARIDELGEAIDTRLQNFHEAVSASDELSDSSISLASQLLVLSGQSDVTGATLDTMGGIVDRLNSNYGELGLTIDETTGKLNYSISDLYDYISKAADEQKQAAAMEGLVGALGQFRELKDASAQAYEEVAAAWDNYEALEEKWQGENPVLKNIAAGAEMNWSSELGTAFDEWEALSDAAGNAHEEYSSMIDEISLYCEQLGYTDEETEEFIKQIENSTEAAAEFSEQMDEAAEQTVSFEEAASTAFSSVEEEVTKLVEAYNETYEAARSSIDSTIGLFDTMKLECETSTQDMMEALESQTDYLNTYVDNLKAAQEYGLDDDLIASLSDGSEESAAYLDTIIDKIEELGGTTEEAKAFVDEMNTSFEEVQTAKDTFATTVAEMQTDFTEKMDAIELEMQQTIEGMNLDTEAAASATATIQAYVDAIAAGKGSAVEAAEQVAAAVAAALNTTTTGPTVTTATTVKGHSRGTINAEDVFVAGEDGPELIVDKGGSTVFPAEETERILESLESPLNISPAPQGNSTDIQNSQTTANDSKKHIVLELSGSGEIEIGSEANRETVLNILQEKLKPVLMSLIRTEIYEEGDLSYDF